MFTIRFATNINLIYDTKVQCYKHIKKVTCVTNIFSDISRPLQNSADFPRFSRKSGNPVLHSSSGPRAAVLQNLVHNATAVQHSTNIILWLTCDFLNLNF